MAKYVDSADNAISSCPVVIYVPYSFLYSLQFK